MNRLLNSILFVAILSVTSALTAKAACPSAAATVIEVCDNAAGNGTIRAYFYGGDPGTSYLLYSITTNQYVSEPLGPVTMKSIPYPPGAVAGIEFELVPDGQYIIRVNCEGGGFTNVGGMGITVNSANALDVGITLDPDCNPATGGANADGSIALNISGGDAPYDISFPTAQTPIAPVTNAAAGNHVFPALDGGPYSVLVTDASNCQFTRNFIVPLATVPMAGADQVVCGSTVSLSANAPGPGEIGTWTGPAGVTFTPNANSRNVTASNLPVGVNTLTWTITDTNGICPGSSDQVDVTSDAPATVDAGAAQTICSGASAVLSGTIGGSATLATWTSSGDGAFDDNTSLTATYTPGAGDLTAGTATLTLTTNDPAGPCVAVTDNVVITINSAVTVDAGAAQTICSDGTATLAGSFGNGATGATWTTSGDGAFDDNTSPTAVYTPGPNDISNAGVTLTYTTNDPAGPCLPATDNVVITIDAAATIDAGAPQTICSGSTVNLAGTRGGSASSSTWTSSGDGSFDDTSLLSVVYTPGPTDLTNGTVTLTLTTNDPAGPCVAVSDNVVITIDQAATVDAGAAQTICADGSATLAGSFAGSATSATWSSSGDGAFNNSGLVNAVYTPGPNDISNGNVTLTLTTNDPAGPCLPVNDNVVITIDAPATVDAGPAQTICAGSTVTMSGTFGPSASSATWSTSGDGSFDNASSLAAVYTPGTADRTAGTVTLTLTTNDPTGPCGPVNDNVVITIDAGAVVDAGPAQTICADGTATLAATFSGAATSGTWSTLGDGSFNDITLPGAVYSPGPTDITNTNVTLTFTTNDPAGPCPASSDVVVLTIQAQPLVDAGAPQMVCAGSTITLAGTRGGSASSTTWSTSGDGAFSDVTALNAVYTPGSADIASGSVTLTLTTDDPAGPCGAVSDNVLMSIDAAATVDAGAPQDICSGSTVTLAGSFGGAATSATWTTSGDGTFDNNTSINAIYTPGSNDRANLGATLTFTTDDPPGSCSAVSDNVFITINALPVANAGANQTVCSGNSVTLAGSISGSASSATWTTSGDGSFDNASILTAVYTPGAADLAATTVTLTLTTNDPAGPCVAASADVVISFQVPAAAEAGTSQILCSGGTGTLGGSSVSGSATTGAWSIVTQPPGGDGMLSDESQTINPSLITFSATVAGNYTLRLTTDDPAGDCPAAVDDVLITVSSVATADAGPAQTICVGGTATLSGAFTGASGITWSSVGDGSFDDPTLTNAVYTPGPADISAGSVTLTITTGGPCAPVSDNVIITINPAPTVDAGPAQTVCSSGSIILNASFGGSATGLVWSSPGDGSFEDNTDPNSAYSAGPNDVAAGSVTLTATATGSCAGTSDNVTITINPAAIVDAGNAQTICNGGTVNLDATLSGAATSMTWTTTGDGSFSNINDPDAVYTPGSNDVSNGSVTLRATTNNPAGPCPAVNDDVVIAFMAIPGDQTTAGAESWIGYVYDDTGDVSAIETRINFASSKYRGFIDADAIDNMSAASTYDVTTDEFDLNLGLAVPVQGPGVCGTLLDDFSVRYTMNKTFSAGIYRFTVGADDGVRLLIDGVNVLPAAAFDFQSYTTYTTDALCLSAGIHSIEIHYFDNAAYSRLSFEYDEVPAIVTNSPVEVCVSSPAPSLTASSSDADVIDYNWYKNGTLVFTGANFTPSASELDMTTAGITDFEVTAIYACGETQPVDVTVSVFNSATLVINDPTICESGGVVDLRTFITPTPAGGAFVFAGHPNISGNNFDASGLAGSSIAITVDYSTGSCTAPQQTINVTVTNVAATTVPASAVGMCEGSPAIDLTGLVSALPSGGVFTFSGNQVTGSNFDPSALSGLQTITVDYSAGGCVAPQQTFDIDVTNSATITTMNANACQNGSPVNLLTLVSAAPDGGSYTFSGTGVTGNLFDPSGLSGTVNINVNYDLDGCTDNATLQITVLTPSDPLCTGGNCSSVVIVPKPEPATCTNSDGRLVMSLKPFTPAVNNTGVRITIDGVSSTDLPISRTVFNDSIFEALPVGRYTYEIEYGDPACIKTGMFSIDQSGTVGTPVVSNVMGPLCPGTATGSLTLDVAGETGNVLEWSLDGGLSDPFKSFTAGSKIDGIPAGRAPTYQHVISVRRNASDVCYSSVTVLMNESVANILATFDIQSATCNGNDGGILNIVASGGNGGPYTYSIDGGQSYQSTPAFNGLAGGTYALRVRDAAYCEKEFTALIDFPGFINFVVSKTNADCSNDGASGLISVTVSDPGVFQVALATDQFNPPSDAEYISYTNPAVTFTQLPRGEYFVFVKSGTSACPTRSAPINIFGVYDVSFALAADCNNNELSLALVNVTGQAGGAPIEIHISKKLTSDPPEIIYQQFPADGEIYLEYDQYAFLKTPGEYRIQLIQFQSEAVCNLPSEIADFTVPVPLNAGIGAVLKSYPDIASGKLNVVSFTGGLYPYNVRIELDSASSFSLPYHTTDFEEASINGNQQIEMAYERVPAGRYQVQVMDSLGCVMDLIARVPLDEDLYIPNVFTPNGDGSNDIFFIRNLPQEPAINQLVITNRWGKEVFVSENYQNNWDAVGVADGIYFYRLEVSDSEPLTGWVEIIRGPKP